MKTAVGAAALVSCLAGLVACLGSPSGAQELPNDWRPAPALRERISSYPETFTAELFGSFRASAGPDQMLRQEDIDQLRQIAAARQRASSLSIFFSSDIDNNGRVTLAEFNAAQRQLTPVPNGDMRIFAERFAKLDLDGDGTLTSDEAKTVAEKAGEAGGDVSSRLQELLSLDPNHDGALSAAELTQLASATFTYYDRDKDGVLSDDERKIVSAENSRDTELRRREQDVANCGFPRAVGQEEVFFVNGLGGSSALSSVSIVGQDEVTNTAELVVEPGETPIYIVALASQPTIWRVTGDVRRITRFVAIAPVKAVGVAGLSKDVVTLLSGRSCLQNRLTDRPSAAQLTAAAFQKAIGRPVRGMFDGLRSSMKLPSQATTPEMMPGRRTADPPVPASAVDLHETPDRLFWRRHPGGLVEIDLASVVASAEAVPYEVPPLEAGLQKLLRDGSIEANGRDVYTIKRPIARMPAGLTGYGYGYIISIAPGITPPSNFRNPAKLLPGIPAKP